MLGSDVQLLQSFGRQAISVCWCFLRLLYTNSQVTDMSYMFRYNSVFNQDIGNWSTSKVPRTGQKF